MALISKRFLDTIQGNNSDITPIVLLGDLNEETKEYDILDLFSTQAVTVHKNDFNFAGTNAIQAKPILKNISSIKNSIDIENRKLKINTFRFSVYNYYDSVKSLSSSDDYVQTEDANPVASLVGKYIILYYKSIGTREIDISQDAIHFDTNDSCPILFKGIITRATISEDIITLQGEDFTQDILKKQQIPSTKISDLEETIRNNTIVEDKETPIPMVFGKVDKSPAIAYRTNYSNNQGLKSLGFLHDIYPTTGKYTTSKLLNDFDTPTYMYVKDGDDYLIFQYETNYYDYLGRTYFLESSEETTTVVPELSESQMQEIYCLGYTYATSAVSDLSYYTSLATLDGTISEDEGVNPDYSALLANYGMKRGWYRQGEIQNLITDEDSFDFGQMTLDTWWLNGKGRWILVQLDKKEVLQGFRCYSKLVHDQNDSTASAGGNNDMDAWRLYIKPFNPDQIKAAFGADFNFAYGINAAAFTHALLGDDTIDGVDQSTVGDTSQKLDPDETQDIRDNLGFFDNPDGNQSYSYNLIGPNGLTHEKVKEDYDNSTPCDRILLWEAHSSWGQTTQTLKCGGYMHSFAAKYLKKIEDYTSSEFYASITGRKDYASTEKLENIGELLQEFEATWTDTIVGEDGLDPDYVGVLDAWDNYFKEKYIFPESDEYYSVYGAGAEGNLGFYTKAQWERHVVTSSPVGGGQNLGPTQEWWDYGIVNRDFGEHGGSYTVPDFSGLGLDDSNFMTSNQIVSIALHGIMKKLHALVILDTQFKTWALFQDEGYDDEMYTGDVWYYLRIDPWGSIGDITDWYVGGGIPSDVLHNTYQSLIEQKIDVGYRRTLIKRVLQYVYQNEIVQENTDSIFQDNGSNQFNYQWNSDELNLYDGGGVLIDGWVDHFGLFMNDTVETALWSDGNSPLWLDYTQVNYDITENQPNQNNADVYANMFNELKSWNDDPIIVGEHVSWTGPGPGPGWANMNWFYGNHDITKLYEYISVDSLEIEIFSGIEAGFDTNGIVNKPIDIIINILSKELKYGLDDNGYPSVEYYNQELIQKNRDFYSSWQMGFCIDKAIDADKLISDFCKETQSFFTFKPDGSFDLVTIKEKYTYEDIEHTIQEEDILKYSFDKTKRENIITSCNYFYRYDNGQNTYSMETGLMTANQLLYGTGYDGDNYYNLSEGVGYKEKNLRYHSETSTARTFQQFDLLNNCNQHLLVTLELPLKYVKIEIGNIIYLPLIKNEKVFGVDYSRVSYLNGQAIYPLWIVTEVDIKLDKVVIKAYQLHHVSTSPEHGFIMPDSEKEIIKINANEFHSEYRNIYNNKLRNWNYYTGTTSDNYEYVHDDSLQIPYGDGNGDGIINVVDLVKIVDFILHGAEGGEQTHTSNQIERMDINQAGLINVISLVSTISYILGPE